MQPLPHCELLMPRHKDVIVVCLPLQSQLAVGNSGHAVLVGSGAANPERATGQRRQRYEASDLEIVRSHASARTAQSLHSLDGEGLRTDSVDVRAHRPKKSAKILNVRL